MLTWNFINSEQTFMYISIIFFCFYYFRCQKRKSIKAPSPSKACPWTHNLRHRHPTWFPLSSSTAQLLEPSPVMPASEHVLPPLPPPQHQPHTQAAILEAHSSPCLTHVSITTDTKYWGKVSSSWASDQAPAPVTCSFVHSQPLSHPYSIHIPHKSTNTFCSQHALS